MKTLMAAALSSVALLLSTSNILVADDALHVTVTGDVGVGTSTPVEKLHVMDGDFRVEQTVPGTSAVLKFATADSLWEIKQNGATGRLTFFSPGGGATTASFKFARQAQENLFRVGILAGDTVDINGKLVINGTDITPDYVFGSDYKLDSIEDHAQQMWQNKHLPALPGAHENEKNGVDIVKHQYGVLEELEIAHIYIAQLNEMVKELRDEVAELKAQQSAVRMATGARSQGPSGQELPAGAIGVSYESNSIDLE
jgi:hypothetical protein